MTDLDRAVRTHCDLYNAAATSGDWTEFLATFTDDVRIVLPRLAPLEGRAAVAAAYRRIAPAPTMRIDRTEPVADGVVRAHFSWDRGGGGAMLVRWRGERVAGMEMST